VTRLTTSSRITAGQYRWPTSQVTSLRIRAGVSRTSSPGPSTSSGSTTTPNSTVST
jgi:hypothetical protein